MPYNIGVLILALCLVFEDERLPVSLLFLLSELGIN